MIPSDFAALPIGTVVLWRDPPHADERCRKVGPDAWRCFEGAEQGETFTDDQLHEDNVVEDTEPTIVPPVRDEIAVAEERGRQEERRAVGRELAALAIGLRAADPDGRLSGSLLAAALSDIASRLEAGMAIEERPCVDVTPASGGTLACPARSR